MRIAAANADMTYTAMYAYNHMQSPFTRAVWWFAAALRYSLQGCASEDSQTCHK